MIPRRAYLKRTPVKRRRTGPPRRSSRVHDPKRLAWLRTLPCWACEINHWQQESHSEAAHIGLSTTHRGLSQKVSDTEAIPLCAEHHRTSSASIHKVGPSVFFAVHGGDRDEVIGIFQELYKESKQ